VARGHQWDSEGGEEPHPADEALVENCRWSEDIRPIGGGVEVAPRRGCHVVLRRHRDSDRDSDRVCV